MKRNKFLLLMAFAIMVSLTMGVGQTLAHDDGGSGAVAIAATGGQAISGHKMMAFNHDEMMVALFTDETQTAQLCSLCGKRPWGGDNAYGLLGGAISCSALPAEGFLNRAVGPDGMLITRSEK